jgi:outer membrane lipoprotein-sorting protein
MRPYPGLAFATIICLGLSGTIAAAQPSTEAFDIGQLMARFSAIKNSTARFNERKYLRMLKTPLEDSGVLVYAAPDKLQKNTLLPKPESLVIEGDSLTIDREGKTQTLKLADYPQIAGLIEGIRATLAGDLPGLQRFYSLYLEGDANAWRLLLKPRDPKMQDIVQSIFISGTGGHIKSIDTLESDGDHSEMTITEDTP